MSLQRKLKLASVLTGTASLVALISSNPAMAQTTANQAGQQVTTLETVVVSARRRDEAVQDTPLSITAFSPDEIQSRGAYNFDDLLSAVPNVTANNGLTIRGIGYNTRNIGIESGATIYVDGVYTGRPPSFNQDLSDISSVSVLRGPQGTLYGKNSIAGVVNITTTLPQLDGPSGRVFGSFGNEGLYRESLTLNTPVSSDAAVRVTLEHNADGGYLKNLFNNTNFGKSDQTVGRAAFLWNLNSHLQVIIRGAYSQERDNDGIGETLLGVDSQIPPPRPIVAPGPFTTVEDSPSHGGTTLATLSGTIRYNFGDYLTLSSITGYEKNANFNHQGQDNSALNNIEVNFNNNQRQLTQEFRATGVIDGFNYVAGLYYFYQDSFQENEGILGTDFAIPPLGIPGGVDKGIDPKGTIDTNSFAGYLDVTYDITPELQLEAGGRLNYEEKRFNFQVTSQAPALFYVIPHGTDNLSGGDFSPTLVARYKFSDSLMAYARYAKGFKSGGWNADFVSASVGVPAPTVKSLKFGQEKAQTYEIGTKGQFFDGTLQIDADAFYTNYANLQVAQFFGINLQAPGSQLSVTSNAGAAHIQGVELEADWRPFEGMLLSNGVGYDEAIYDRFQNVDGHGASAAGHFFIGVPKWTENATAQYTYPISGFGVLQARGDGNYQSKTFGDALDSPLKTTPGFWSLNARLGYIEPNGKWQIFLWSRNITNHLYAVNEGVDQFAVQQSSPVQTVVYGRPRTYGIELQANF